jgi:hypothetical protein
VEVVVNHLEPYRIKGEPSTLHLDELFKIDTENNVVAELGLFSIWDFDVDSEGSIYFLNRKGRENFVYKFDIKGNFITSLCPKGQGPGAIEDATYLSVNHQDEIIVEDIHLWYKFFTKEGKPIKKIRSGMDIQTITFLENGKYLVLYQYADMYKEYSSQFRLRLCNPDLEELKELDRYDRPNALMKPHKGVYIPFVSSVSNRRIYTGCGERSYEIWVYDLDGNLVKKIKKEYKHIQVPESIKKRFRKPYRNAQHRAVVKNVRLPKYMPPYRYFFTDDEGRLYVMTNEQGESLREYMYDIFNPDGAFIGRTSLRNCLIHPSGFVEPLKVVSKMNRLYCMQEKDNGYEQLVAYKMWWD